MIVRNHMTVRHRRPSGWIIPLMVLLVIMGYIGGSTAQEAAGEVGIGGTGLTINQERGIGGTGIAPVLASGDRGIGGTGIIGEITQFGSIWVNGLHVQMDESLPVNSLHGPLSSSDLKLGQITKIEADEISEGVFKARSISVDYPVSGPVSLIDAASGRLKVLGQWVEVPVNGTNSSEIKQTLAQIQVGEHLDVSGFRRPDGTIEASRLDQAPRGAQVGVTGLFSVNSTDGTARIGDLPLAFPARNYPISSGQTVTAVGAVKQGRLYTSRLQPQSTIPFEGRLTNLSIEGFVQPQKGGQRVLNGLPLRQDQAKVGERVVLQGRITDKHRFEPKIVSPSQHRFLSPSRGLRPPAPGSGDRLDNQSGSRLSREKRWVGPVSSPSRPPGTPTANSNPNPRTGKPPARPEPGKGPPSRERQYPSDFQQEGGGRTPPGFNGGPTPGGFRAPPAGGMRGGGFSGPPTGRPRP
ncbi:MAG: hypothetical protein HQL67_11520 [Magnetococcales bacterium]|nr:hypothetical protein [Magnetococcales bacterium]